MKFDISPKIKLADTGKYIILRGVLFLILIIALILISINFFFSSSAFIYSADTPKNSSLSKLSENIFFTSMAGNFSNVRVEINSDKSIENSKLNLKKSYQAFLYPEGDPIGFQNGTLLKDDNNFYTVSENKLRKFKSVDILTSLGFNKNSFQKVNREDFKFNDRGTDISSEYPDYTIFKIENDYFQLNENILTPFISKKAFKNQYPENIAIEKPKEFLDAYEKSEEFIGFSTGSLISYGNSIYITERNRVHPINNPTTFTLSGFSWENVIPISSEELSIYNKKEPFKINSIHPEGTIFYARDSQTYYYIEDNRKRKIPTENILETYLFGKKEIVIESKSATSELTCELKRSLDLFSRNKYSCTLPLNKINNFSGKDWQFEFENYNAQKIKSIFSKEIDLTNFRSALGDIKSKIILKYYE